MIIIDVKVAWCMHELKAILRVSTCEWAGIGHLFSNLSEVEGVKCHTL